MVRIFLLPVQNMLRIVKILLTGNEIFDYLEEIYIT